MALIGKTYLGVIQDNRYYEYVYQSEDGDITKVVGPDPLPSIDREQEAESFWRGVVIPER